MAFIEDMQGRDLALLQTLDGRIITYTPQNGETSGSPRVIAGMFQAFSEAVGGETVDVLVNNPILSVRTMDVPELAAGDVFAIDGQDYEAAVIRPDSEGITEIMMEQL